MFLDLQRAFDTVPHDSLLDMLNTNGVRSIMLNVFEKCLRDSKQIPKIENVYSHPQQVGIGVPQGSVLGPIVFAIYINLPTFMFLMAR